MKRKAYEDEELEPSEIYCAKERVTIRGVVTEVSPVKESRKNPNTKYFTGKISDGKKTMRAISFDPKLRNKLDDYCKTGTSLALTECEIKEDSAKAGFEIKLTRGTAASKLEKVYELPADLSSIDPDTACKIRLEELQGLAVNQKVTVRAKVVEVRAPEEIKQKGTWRSLCKQDCVIADDSCTARVVLWQKNVGKLREDYCYDFKKLTVRVYDGLKFLSVSDNSDMKEVDDIGDVAAPDDDDDKASGALLKLIEGEISAVLYSEHYGSCVTCGGKVKEKGTVLAECTKCGATMKRARCKSSSVAKVVVHSEDGMEHRLTLFDNILKPLIPGYQDGDIVEKLLELPKLKIAINKSNIVCSAKELVES